MTNPVLRNTLKQLYATDAVKVITLTQETQATAAKMSFNIRKRDMERVRIGARSTYGAVGSSSKFTKDSL